MAPAPAESLAGRVRPRCSGRLLSLRGRQATSAQRQAPFQRELAAAQPQQGASRQVTAVAVEVPGGCHEAPVLVPPLACRQNLCGTTGCGGATRMSLRDPAVCWLPPHRLLLPAQCPPCLRAQKQPGLCRHHQYPGSLQPHAAWMGRASRCAGRAATPAGPIPLRALAMRGQTCCSPFYHGNAMGMHCCSTSCMGSLVARQPCRATVAHARAAPGGSLMAAGRQPLSVCRDCRQQGCLCRCCPRPPGKSQYFQRKGYR
jgi:hypothetical protein